MTPEELEAAVRSGNTARCLAVLRGALEEERRAAAPTALRLRKQAMDHWGVEKGPLAEVVKRVGHAGLNEASFIAFLGTASLTEIKKLGNAGFYPSDHTIAVLRDRRPSWLQPLAEWLIELSPWYWPTVYQMVREGLCERPTSEAWLLGLMAQGSREPTPREILTADPVLLECEVWRLFEAEGGGEHSLAACDKYRAEERTWSRALLELSRDGILNRQRLLDASLDALERDFAQFRAGWHSRFHEALAPTVEERTARTERYLGLLGSRIPPTVSFALKALESIEKAGHLPAQSVAEGVGPALLAREKKTVIQALKLLDRAAKREKALAPAVAVAAVEALAHEAPDVQETALTLIERHGARGDAALREALRARLEDTAASLQDRMAALIGEPAAPAAPAGDASGSLEELIACASRLPADLARRAGVEAAVRAARENLPDVPAISFEITDVPRLTPETRIEPIRNLDELIDVLARVLENQGLPEEIERAMDGVSRFCAERPADWEKRTAPLRKRAHKLRAHEEQRFGGWDLRGDLACLVVAWLDGETNAVKRLDEGLPGYLAARLLELAKRVAKKGAAPLLSAPTHLGGWIDPRELVARVSEPGSDEQGKAPLDLITALLRLAPDGRAEALAAAKGLPGEVGEAVRYALGAEGVRIGPSAPLWIAAARARAPLASDPEVEARHPGLGPGAGLVPRPELCWSSEQHTYSGRTYTYWREKLVLDPAGRKKVEACYPTVRHYGSGSDHSYETGMSGVEYGRWVTLIWPAGREAFFASGAVAISNNLDWWGACWGNRNYLEPLLEPDTPLGPMGRLLLGLGLAAKEPGENGLATDVLIGVVSDGRLDGAGLGAVLARLLGTGPVKPPRLAKTLGDAARASALHAQVVREGLFRGLGPGIDKRPADMAPLLELLRELCVQTGETVTEPPARAYLESLAGSGKTAALAKALLALKPGQRQRHLAAAYALAGRLERAERWQALHV